MAATSSNSLSACDVKAQPTPRSPLRPKGPSITAATLHEVCKRGKLLKYRLASLGVRSGLILVYPSKVRLKQQRTARLKARQRSIKPSASAETFPGQIIVKSRKEAIQAAKQECKSKATNERMVFWTDGSFQRRTLQAGAAVVFKARKTLAWMSKAFKLNVETSDDAELFAISAALEVAWNELTASFLEVPLTQVAIYSDSQTCLERIKKWEPDCEFLNSFSKPLYSSIMWRARDMMRMGVKIELLWVPAHSAVYGNVGADAIAKQARCRIQTDLDWGYISPTEIKPWERYDDCSSSDSTSCSSDTVSLTRETTSEELWNGPMASSNI